MGMVASLLRITQAELDEYLVDSSVLENRIDNWELAKENSLNIDKSWDGILYLLTGQNYMNTDHPLASVLFSGQFIDEKQDMGLGPAQYLLPSQVKHLNGIITTITEENLRERYQPKRMAEMS